MIMSGESGSSGTKHDPISSEIKDYLAMALNEDWERFAGFILEDNDIQRISMDNPLVYDKCFEMLNLWERMSENPVSKGMVKQKLIKLKRNDILSSLEEKFGPIQIVTSDSYGSNVTGSENKNLLGMQKTGLKIAELKMRTIDQLACKLDHSPGVGVTNWKNLAYELIDKKSNLAIKNLELHYFGGGNPALEFLKRLSRRNPTITVGEFQDVCRSFKRMDIVLYIDSELKKNHELRSIDSVNKEKIASYLNLNIPGVYNWEMFADEYGFNQDDIKQIRSHIKEGRSYSPTKQLFELLRQTRPDMTVETLKQACQKLGRNDIVNILNEVGS